MRSLLLLACSISLLPTPAFGVSHSRRGPTAHGVKHSATRPKRTLSRSSGQHSIDDQRATQIQTALVGAGYLSGETSGHWDATTEAAMEKFQADNGWQTKLIPDARAIIKLGLGPGQVDQSGTGSRPGSSGPAL